MVLERTAIDTDPRAFQVGTVIFIVNVVHLSVFVWLQIRHPIDSNHRRHRVYASDHQRLVTIRGLGRLSPGDSREKAIVATHEHVILQCKKGDCRHTRAWNTTMQKRRLSPRAWNTALQKGDCRRDHQILQCKKAIVATDEHGLLQCKLYCKKAIVATSMEY